MPSKISKCGRPPAAQRSTVSISPASLRWASQRRTAAPKPRPNVPPRLPRRRCLTCQAAFLAAYRTTASVPAAAKAAGIRPAQHEKWLAKDAKYWQAFADVQEVVAETLQDQAVQRAMEGWEEPVLYRGRLCGTIRHHSDRLLLFLLKAWKPEEWG